MAEQVPYGVATSLLNTLASLAFKEIASIYGVKAEIEWLKETVQDIKAVLSDADQKQNTDQLIQRWISKLKRVLYEADDLLDEIHTQHLLQQRDSKGKGKGKAKVREFFSSSNPIVSRHKISREIRNIREKFNDVAEAMSKLNFDRRVVEVKPERSTWRETSSKPEDNFIGREESMKEIIDLLLNTDSNEDVSLVAIVGIGGLGKTALAQLAYNNDEVSKSFDKRMWVCVSEDFDVKVLVKKILESSVGHDVNDQPLQLLQSKLEENLIGQRYLLVLDDVWNEDREMWLQLKKYLTCGAQGSKILVTARNQMVADKMGVKASYSLKGLTDDQSWTLLRSLAFEQDKMVTQSLESISQKIAKKCGGVPLALRVMGSLLQSKSRESEWEAILEGDFWKSCEGSIMPILSLSYDSLAIELKQCFAYCSLYPKDWQYRKDTLIDMWMAQGFLEKEDEIRCPEDIGEQYVHILLKKSFLQDVKTDWLGKIKYFKMHDLMHDLSQLIAGFDYCLYVEGRKNVARCPIHASFENYYDSSLTMLDPERLRTFLLIKQKCRWNRSHLFEFKRLRSLDLSSEEVMELPKSIGKMSHLRYLNLAYCSKLTCLPKSISNLVNLQTLILTSCSNLKFCVDIITKLINLRRLDIDGCKAFEDGMPIGLGRVTTLQRLSNFIVGDNEKQKKKSTLNELKDLNLRGRLHIQNLDLVRDVEESKDVNLRTKKNLTSLCLFWGDHSDIKSSDPKQLLENLCPHQNLKELSIMKYPGVCLSNWLLFCKNLVELCFFDIRNCQYLPTLEGFVSLKNLCIENMPKLECIYYKRCSSSTNFFPSLEDLQIVGCRNLRGWIREANVQSTRDDNDESHNALPSFSHLSYLRIEGCPNLSCMPTFPNLVRYLELIESSTKPLLDTLNVSAIGPSTSDDHMAASLSKLESLHIGGIDIEALPEEWMQNLSSLKKLSIKSFLSLEKPFRHMQNLPSTLEELIINIRSSNNLESFPEGMCRLTNLRTLRLYGASLLLKERCKRNTGADWPKIAHIPNIWFGSDRI